MDSSEEYGIDACLKLHISSTAPSENEQNISESQAYCGVTWDGFNCWKSTPSGQTAFTTCPLIKGSDSTHQAFRKCGDSGKWLNREGVPSDNGWSNYTDCFTPEIREIMRRLGSQDEAQKKLDIALNTRILELVGLSLSLTALLLSLVIFFKFRTLRNSRTRLHKNLFIAMVIQVAIRLTLYIDQAITRSSDNLHTSGGNFSSQGGLRGIDNTPILCETGYVLLEYARTAMFMWCFVEGLYLHNMITVTVFEEKLSPLIYSIVGWVLPIPLTIAWATVTALNYGSTTCWWGYNFTLYFWILEGPRISVLMVNFVFLLNILRVLVTKLQRSNSSETQQARKALKAFIILLPLLGLTNMFNMLHAPLDTPWIFAMWSYTTHFLTSFQGFILSYLYCCSNEEVQLTLKKYFQSKFVGRNKVRLPRSSIRMSLLNHTVVAQIEGGPRNNNQSHEHGLRNGTATDRLLPIHQDKVQLKFNHLKGFKSNLSNVDELNSSDNSSNDEKLSGILLCEEKGKPLCGT